MPSPHPSAAGLLPSPQSASGAVGRPPLMKRHSSQQSHGSGRHAALSPGSAGEHHQPLRHHVKPVRKTKIVLPRNNSSARNLAKLARHGSDQHAQNGNEAHRHSRQRSHESGEGIRLPGSLDESKPVMRRNLTSSNLPRNQSHTKLKKNLSHGQLARIGSGRNLQGLTAKGPPSPGLKGKGKKKRSLDAGYPEKDLHEQEMEIARQQQEAKEGPRRVGFAVGDGNDSSDEDDGLEMEGSGMQEDEWTDQSASASPATTRQNTANNSRRPSVTAEKPPDKSHLRESFTARDVQQPHYQHSQAPLPPAVQPSAPEADGTPPGSHASGSDEEDPPSPRSMPHSQKNEQTSRLPPPSEPISEAVQFQPPPPSQSTATPKSLLHGAKDHPSPFTKQLLDRNNHNPAPALVSNVSAMDESRSARGSPAASMRSTRSNVADHNPDVEDELVSRFIPSASHPSTNSGGNTTANTPKIGSYQTPDSERSLYARGGDRSVATSHPPTSPGSTISGSSGAATPAMLRSRTELRMANDRAMAEIEGSGKPQLMIPAHRFDRRNESLKSYLNVAALGGDGRGGGIAATGLPYGPEIFEGRFKAINTELKVVQRFRDPLGESLARLQKMDGARFRELRGKKSEQPRAEKMPISKSAVGLSKQGSRVEGSSPPGLGAKSASPAKSAMMQSKSATNVTRAGGSGRVKFTTAPPETREVDRPEEEAGGLLEGVDALAKQIWGPSSKRPGEVA